MPKIQHYSFSGIRRCNGDVFGHTSLHVITTAYYVPLHDHDYYEIECGLENCGLQQLNGEEVTFQSNDVYLLRPEDTHRVTVGEGEVFRFYNVAFDGVHLRSLFERYGIEVAGRWLNQPGWPRKWHLSPNGVNSVRKAIVELSQDRFREVALDRFLLNFFHVLESNLTNPYQSCPQWLQDAIFAIDTPKWMRFGPKALAEISGFSQEYVSRALKKCAGVTPGEVLNRVRMEHAALELSMRLTEVPDIAEQCGFRSLSYFFKLFHRTYGCTPQEYRRRYR